MADFPRGTRGQPVEIGEGRAVALHQLDGLQELVRAGGSARAAAQPHVVMDGDMGKPRRDLLEMLVELLEPASAFDLPPCIGEHGAVAGDDVDLIAELFRELVQAPLGHVGPDAEHVGIIGNFDLGHGFPSRLRPDPAAMARLQPCAGAKPPHMRCRAGRGSGGTASGGVMLTRPLHAMMYTANVPSRGRTP